MVVGEAVWPWVRDSIGTSAYSSASLQQEEEGTGMAGYGGLTHLKQAPQNGLWLK
jgi:hypothetical protein